MILRALASSATWVLPPLLFSAVSIERNMEILAKRLVKKLAYKNTFGQDFCCLSQNLRLNRVFIDLGAAYGTAKSGVGICSMGVLKPDLIFKSIVPIIMAGILGIYGLIVAVILNNKGKYLRTQISNGN
jgi:hypothetical protein